MEYLYSIQDGIKRYHYVYRITNIVENKHYYGVRTTDKDKETHPLDDLGEKYFSSSTDEDFMKDQKENPQNYKYKILKTFDNRQDAVLIEIKLHTKFNVKLHESFYNKANQTVNGFDSTGSTCDHRGSKNSMYGKHHTDESKKKIGIKSLGRFKGHSNDTRQKLSISKITKYSNPEYFEKWKESLRTGDYHPSCKNITIYNNEDEIVYISTGNFTAFCEKYELPHRALVESYTTSTKLYAESRPTDTKRLINNGNIKFKGWYAKINQNTNN